MRSELEYQRIVVEIGSSNGQFLCQLAEENRDYLCIGIEIDGSLCRAALQQATSRKLENVVMHHAEGYSYLRNHFESASIDDLHVYFPTPYPNSLNQNPEIARKVQGRLFNRSFVLEMERVLTTGGMIRVVTDHEAYFDAIVAQMEDSMLIPMPWSPPIRARSEFCRIGTRWERSQRNLGKRIFYLQFMR